MSTKRAAVFMKNRDGWMDGCGAARAMNRSARVPANPGRCMKTGMDEKPEKAEKPEKRPGDVVSGPSLPT